MSSTPSSTRPSGNRTMNKFQLVKSATGMHQMTTLAVGQLGRNISQVISVNKIPSTAYIGGFTAQLAPALVQQARNDTIWIIRRVVRVSNELLRHGQKCMALYISNASEAQLVELRSFIFNKGRFATEEEAVKAAAKKRLKATKGGTAGGTVEGGSEPTDVAEETPDGMGNAVDLEEEGDETGTKGDHGGFFKSLLGYLRNPTSTIRVLPNPRSNQRNQAIGRARAAYQALAAITKQSLEVQSCGKSSNIYQQLTQRPNPPKGVPLDSGIIATLGTMLAVQFRRYFIDKMAGLNTRLPQSPVRHGHVLLSETQLYSHLMQSFAVQRYLYAINGAHNPGLSELSPGWALTQLVTPVGHSMHAPANPHPLSRTTATATVGELRALVTAIRNRPPGTPSSSQLLMNGRTLAEQMIPNQNLRPGQPRNLLPSYLLRGTIVTDGRSLSLLAIDLRKRAKERFIKKVTLNTTDGHWYRQHVLAPDNRRFLPNISTAIPGGAARAQLFPDRGKVDIGAIDLGKEFAVAFACTRYDSPRYMYTIKAKSKALYQPTNKARKEGELVKAHNVINVQTPVTGVPNTFTASALGVQEYELTLSTLDASPVNRIRQERDASYTELTGFYNKHGRHQKRQAQARRARQGEFDVLTNHILTAMGTHRSTNPHRRGFILVGSGSFSTSTKGYQASLHESSLRHFLPRARGLGYLVMGIDEHYTSRRCPRCQRTGSNEDDFVGYVGIRATHCPWCQTWFHRDLLAASNMVQAGRYYLPNLSRPEYLLPITKDGKKVFNPWYGPLLTTGVPPSDIHRRLRR